MVKHMDRLSYQQKAWRRNRNRIIGILNQESLTFTKLIEKSRLSRAVVHEHLKALLEDGSVEKVYKDGKILNVLQPLKLDLVEWFLRQLEVYELPREVIEKGKVVLNNHILISTSIIYAYLLNNVKNILESSEPEREAVINEDPWLLEKFTLTPLKTKAPLLMMNIKSHVEIGSEKEEEIVQKLISELNPYLFNVILTAYQIEKWLFSKWSEEMMNREEFFFSILSDEAKKTFDKVSMWWLQEVSEYLPSSRFFQLLTLIYSNSLSKKLRKTE